MVNRSSRRQRRLGRASRAGAALVAAVLVAGLATAAAAADPAEGQKRYEACMTQARENPKQGLKSAQAWSKQGGGPPSRHCAAVATLALHKYRDAATQMEQVSAEELKNGNTTLAAELLAQAGQAWQLAGDMARAFAAQSRGLELNPDDVELRIDRGLSLADQKKYWEALDDLNVAQQLAPNRPDVLVWMATAYRQLEVYDLARELVDQALAIEPDYPDALLQRANLRHLAGDTAGALADWARVVKLARDTPAGSAAQANLKHFGKDGAASGG